MQQNDHERKAVTDGRRQEETEMLQRKILASQPNPGRFSPCRVPFLWSGVRHPLFI